MVKISDIFVCKNFIINKFFIVYYIYLSFYKEPKNVYCKWSHLPGKIKLLKNNVVYKHRVF